MVSTDLSAQIFPRRHVRATAVRTTADVSNMPRYPLNFETKPEKPENSADEFIPVKPLPEMGEKRETQLSLDATSPTANEFEREFARAYGNDGQEQNRSAPRSQESNSINRIAHNNSGGSNPKSTIRPSSAGEMDQESRFASWSGEGGNLESLQDVRPPAPNGGPLQSEGINDPSGALATPTWWKERVVLPLNTENEIRLVDTNSLVFEAIKNSPRIQAISQNPLIRDLQVIEADADFDPIHFVRSKFEDREDPVGNTLTTGGAPFLKDHIWSGEFGLRKKTRTGASVQLSEKLGFHNSNSSFFVPQDQGTATLALNVSQPLMRGRGRYYNQSQILIAQASGGVAWDNFVNELQDELQQVAESYWRLYYDRSLYLQKKRNVERGSQILDILEGRSELDSLPNQIARTRSAVQSRRTELANAFRDVRNSETEIRRRIADRDWLVNQTVELIPNEPPVRESLELPLDQVVYTALEHRREIKETMKRAKIAGIQCDISANEILPELSFLVGTYVSALKGESQLGQAIQDHLGEVTPGYHVGFEFEIPYRNRAAQSRLAQRKLQLVKIKAEVDETIQNVVAESQVSLRRVDSAIQTLEAAELAIVAAKADLEQNYRRWESFALVEGDLADGQTPTTMLDQVLNSQERLTAAELVFAQAELELKNAEVALQRTMGTLLIHENIDYSKVMVCNQPEISVDQYRPAELIEEATIEEATEVSPEK